MMKLYFIVSLLLVGSAFKNAYGQGTVKGVVSDANTGEPLQGVYVVYGTGQGTITAEDGSYSFTATSGNLSVTFRFVGYKDQVRNITVSSVDTVELNVSMHTEIMEIGQIVVSASRSEQRVSELTVSMDILSQADISSTHITDSKELLNKTTGIEVIDGQASIRGGTGFSYGVGSRVLALIDGLPVLSPDAGNIKWQFLPLENISQIEIIKGASSVLYGSSALNGVINFRTLQAPENPETKFFLEGGVFGKPANRDWIWWDSPRFFSSASVSHLQKSGKNDIGVAFTITDDNSYRKFNDETLGRFSLRLKHYNAAVRGLEYGMNINSGYTRKTDFILWENAETGALKQDTSSVSDLKGSFVAFDPFITYEGEKLKHDLKFRILASENRFPVRDQNNSDAFSVYGEYQAGFVTTDMFNIVSGLSGNYTSITSRLYGNHTGVNLAGFTQFEGNVFEKLKLVTGVRIEYNSLDGENDRIVPVFRTGVNWQAGEYTFIRGSFGQGYRYPSVAEKHAATTLGAVRIIPNPEIQSEHGWSSELGIKQGLMFGEVTGQADLALFVTRNNDLIEYIFGLYPDEATGVFDFGFRSTNVEQSRILGYEIELILNHSTGKLGTHFNGGYTFINPVEINSVSFEKTGKYLKYRRKHSLKLSGSADYGKFEAGLSFFYRSAVLAIDDVFTGELTREQILPGFYDYWIRNNKGYILLDASLNYNLSPKFSLSFAVKNLTNTEYLGRPGDIQPHRNFSLRFGGKF